MSFQALDTAVSGANLARLWLDTVSDNIANANTIRPADEEPFRARLVIAQAVEGKFGDGAGRGVRVQGLTTRDGDPELVYDPSHPLADEDGNVKRASVDMSQEMSNLVVAQRLYQANLSVLQHAREAYRSALQIGRR